MIRALMNYRRGIKVLNRADVNLVRILLRVIFALAF